MIHDMEMTTTGIAPKDRALLPSGHAFDDPACTMEQDKLQIKKFDPRDLLILLVKWYLSFYQPFGSLSWKYGNYSTI